MLSTTDMSVQAYEHEAYASLPTFDEVSDLPSSILDKTQRGGEVIVRFGCQQLVALSLLHKHFDLAPDERLVRSWDDTRNAHAVPIRAEEAERAGALPWLWRYTKGSAGMGWYPLEYVEPSPLAVGMHQLIGQSHSLLEELAAALVEHQIDQVFGVCGLYADHGFDIDPTERTVENSWESPRRLELHVESKSEPVLDHDGPSTVTLYKWAAFN